jgi:hypothetical protein
MKQAPAPLSALLQVRLEPLRELCEPYGVETLELCGSAAKGTFGPARSAINLIAAFRNRPQGDYAKRSWDIWLTNPPSRPVASRNDCA